MKYFGTLFVVSLLAAPAVWAQCPSEQLVDPPADPPQETTQPPLWTPTPMGPLTLLCSEQDEAGRFQCVDGGILFDCLDSGSVQCWAVNMENSQ